MKGKGAPKGGDIGGGVVDNLFASIKAGNFKLRQTPPSEPNTPRDPAAPSEPSTPRLDVPITPRDSSADGQSTLASSGSSDSMPQIVVSVPDLPSDSQVSKSTVDSKSEEPAKSDSPKLETDVKVPESAVTVEADAKKEEKKEEEKKQEEKKEEEKKQEEKKEGEKKQEEEKKEEKKEEEKVEKKEEKKDELESISLEGSTSAPVSADNKPATTLEAWK